MTPVSRSVSTQGAARPTLAFPQGAGGMEWTGERFVSRLRGEIRVEHHHRYLAAATVCGGLDVLDIASGEGFGSALLATVARSVVGVDRDAEAVAYAAGAYGTPGLRFVEGTCEAIPLADASVDAVVSFETIEHIEAHDRFLEEVRRVLRPGGFFLCSTPDRRVYRSGDEPNEFHLKELDRAEFEALLGRHFAGHAVVGQRVAAGSWVLPLEGEGAEGRDEGDGARGGLTLFETEDGASYRRTAGVASAVYLLGVAGDGTLPSLPLGGAVDAALRPGVLEAERRDAEERARAASAAADRARAEASRLRNDLAARDASLRDARSQAEAAARRADAERARAEAAESGARALRAEGARLAAALNDAQARVEATEASLAGRERALAQAAERERALMAQRDETRRELAACRAEVRRMEASRSWRITAPLRAVGMLFRKGGSGSV